MPKFLLKNGKFAAKRGRLVAVNNPADCDCCEPPCGDVTSSGGAGVTVTKHRMPSRAGNVQFIPDAYTIPDKFLVEGGGQVFVDTGEMSDRKEYTFFKPAGLTEVTVTVTGPDGTGWEYFLGCPDPVPTTNPFP
jgi:hypothetical protein